MDDLKEIVGSEEIMGKVGLKRLKEKMQQGGGNADAVRSMLGLDQAGSDPKTSNAQVIYISVLWHTYPRLSSIINLICSKHIV